MEILEDDEELTLLVEILEDDELELELLDSELGDELDDDDDDDDDDDELELFVLL